MSKGPKIEWTGELGEYISLDQAKLQALEMARSDPAPYQKKLKERELVWEVKEGTATEDYYRILLTFRPADRPDLAGRKLGEEEFYIDVTGKPRLRQILRWPRLGGFPVALAAGIGGVVVLGAVGGIVAMLGVLGGAASEPTPTPIPGGLFATATATATPTAPSTPLPTPTATRVPTATPTPRPLPTATPTLPATPRPTPTPLPSPTPTPRPTGTPAPTPTAVGTPVPGILNPSADTWRMYLGGAFHTGFNPEEKTFKPPFIVKWGKPLPNGVFYPPAIADGMVVVGTEEGDIFALDLNTGESLWRATVVAGVPVTAPLIGGQVVIATAGGTLALFDKASGRSLGGMSMGTDQELTSPTIIRRLVLLGSTAGKVYAIDTTQREWKVVWEFATEGPVYAPPTVGALTQEKALVFVGLEGPTFYTLDLLTGEPVAKYPLDSPVYFSPSYNKGEVYVPSGEFIYKFDAETGQLFWRSFPLGDWVTSPPTLVEDKVYITTEGFQLKALSRRTGEIVWSYDYSDKKEAQNPYPIIANGVVYLNLADEIRALDATGGKLLFKVTRTTGEQFTSVVIAAGKLVVGLGGEQWAGKPGWVTAFVPGTPPPTPTPKDTTPPVIEFLSPKDGEVLPFSPKELKARVIDLESGVDPKSISVGLLGGIVVTVGSPGFSFTETKEGVDFAITIVKPFPPGIIGWEVSAKDKAGNGVTKKATFTIATQPPSPTPTPSLGAQKVELTVAPYSTAKYAVALKANQRLDVNLTITTDGPALPDIHFFITNSQGQKVWDYGLIAWGGPFYWIPFTSDTYTLIFSNQGLVTSLYTKRITLELKY